MTVDSFKDNSIYIQTRMHFPSSHILCQLVKKSKLKKYHFQEQMKKLVAKPKKGMLAKFKKRRRPSVVDLSGERCNEVT